MKLEWRCEKLDMLLGVKRGARLCEPQSPIHQEAVR